MNKQSFQKALNSHSPMIIDGGLATQLEAQGCDIRNALWSASLLQTNPDAIVEVLASPYDEQVGNEHYAAPPRPDQVVHETFCGT